MPEGIGKTLESTSAVILAAGQGTRMKSALPKVLHAIAGRPLVHYPVRAALEAGCGEVVVVVGHGRERLEAYLSEAFGASAQGIPEAWRGRVKTAVQKEQRGTGDAARAGLDAVRPGAERVLVFYGDVPLLTAPDVAAVVAKLVAIKDGRSDVWPERGESSAPPRSLVIGLPTAAAVNSVVIVRNAEPAGYDGGCIEAVTTGARRATASCLDFVAHRLRFVLVVDVRELVRGESGTMGSFDSSPSRPVFDVTVVDETGDVVAEFRGRSRTLAGQAPA